MNKKVDDRFFSVVLPYEDLDDIAFIVEIDDREKPLKNGSLVFEMSRKDYQINIEQDINEKFLEIFHPEYNPDDYE